MTNRSSDLHRCGYDDVFIACLSVPTAARHGQHFIFLWLRVQVESLIVNVPSLRNLKIYNYMYRRTVDLDLFNIVQQNMSSCTIVQPFSLYRRL